MIAKLTGSLEEELDFVLIIMTGFHGDLVIVGGTFQDLGKVDEIHAKHHITIASETGEAFSVQVDGDQRNVRSVHGLQRHAIWSALPARLGDQILHRVEDLLQHEAFLELGFKHGRR